MRPVSQCNEELRQSLIRVAKGLGDIAGSLPENERKSCSDVVSTLTRSVVPQLSEDCPLLVAVTGGGSTGKSTVFNFLAGAKVSASDPRAGYTRRMVAAIHPKVAADRQKMELLFERFRANARPRALSSPEEALEPGDPVYVECPNVPEHLVLVDTPDFDTGTREGFTNRDAAKEILEVADVILYVTVNALYNNKSATDFARSVLSGIGVKKVALLYRLLPFYDEGTVREHMSVTLSNLYPDARTANEACIGIWRIDESNEVAAGVCDPEIRPVDGGPPLLDVLAALDPTKTRMDVLRGEIEGVLRHGDKWILEAGAEAQKYADCRDRLKSLTSNACDECLLKTPQRGIVRLFAEEWEKAQPWFVRNGHWLSRSARKVVGAFRKGRESSNCAGPSFAEAFRTEFLRSVRGLQLECARVPRPASLDVDDGAAQPVGEVLERMGAQALEIVGETESFRPDARVLVRSVREKMTTWQSFTEWSSASLDTIALVGTLSYVVATGDAFTGGTLMSMFGLNDLVAIPALSAYIAAKFKIDKKIVEEQTSGPLKAWLNSKKEMLLPVLEDGITGRDIAACDKTAKRLGDALVGLKAAIADARKQTDTVFGK